MLSDHLVVDTGWSCREGCAPVQAPLRPGRQYQAGKPSFSSSWPTHCSTLTWGSMPGEGNPGKGGELHAVGTSQAWGVGGEAFALCCRISLHSCLATLQYQPTGHPVFVKTLFWLTLTVPLCWVPFGLFAAHTRQGFFVLF